MDLALAGCFKPHLPLRTPVPARRSTWGALAAGSCAATTHSRFTEMGGDNDGRGDARGRMRRPVTSTIRNRDAHLPLIATLGMIAMSC